MKYLMKSKFFIENKKDIKLFEHTIVEYEDIIIYGEYLKDEFKLGNKFFNGISNQDSWDYRIMEDDIVEYSFFFRKNSDLSEIEKYMEDNKLDYRVEFIKGSYYDTLRVIIDIKYEIIKEYIELLNSAEKYNL